MVIKPIEVEYVDHMGDDLRVANVARVSFAKWKEEFDEKDAKLIKYLADHNHWTPFAHAQISIRVTAPIFLARQLVKHQIGLVWNEESRRYVDHEPSFYLPDVFHGRPDNKKQGSGEALDFDYKPSMAHATGLALESYNMYLREGVCPEEARMVLPLNTNTSWIWTGSLAAFARVFNQRSDGHAQLAAQEFASKLGEVVQPLFPVCWDLLTNKEQ